MIIKYRIIINKVDNFLKNVYEVILLPIIEL